MAIGNEQTLLRRNALEAELQEESRGYREIRALAQEQIGKLLGGAAELTPEEEHAFFLEAQGIMNAEIGEVVNGGTGANILTTVENMERFAAQLLRRKNPTLHTLQVSRDRNTEDIAAAEQLIQEIRIKRFDRIVALRDILDDENTSDIDRAAAAKECCGLLEEEISSARADGDDVAASNHSMLLERVRAQGGPSQEAIDESEKDTSESLAAELVTIGEVRVGDAAFITKQLLMLLREHRGNPNAQGLAMRAVLWNYKKAGNTQSVSKHDIDPKSAFVGR